MENFFLTIQDFVLGLPDAIQFLGVVAVGAIPFIESYGAATIGIAAGIPIPVAVAAAIIGNVASVLLVVFGIAGIRSRATSGRPTGPGRETGARGGDGKRGKVAATVRRVGVPGASLLGPLVLPSQFTSAAMVGIGADRRAVAAWTSLAVALWGLAIGLAAAGLFSAAGVI